MISSLAANSLAQAQTLLESSARRIAQGPPAPEDMVNLLRGRQQFSAATKVIQTEDQMTRKLLDIFV